MRNLELYPRADLYTSFFLFVNLIHQSLNLNLV